MVEGVQQGPVLVGTFFSSCVHSLPTRQLTLAFSLRAGANSNPVLV